MWPALIADHSEVFGLDACHSLTRRHGNFSYRVTLSRATMVDPAIGWRSGRIANWLRYEMPDLSGSWVLCAGPPGFVEACVEVAKAQGARDGRILTDSFTATPEAPAAT